MLAHHKVGVENCFLCHFINMTSSRSDFSLKPQFMCIYRKQALAWHELFYGVRLFYSPILAHNGQELRVGRRLASYQNLCEQCYGRISFYMPLRINYMASIGSVTSSDQDLDKLNLRKLFRKAMSAAILVAVKLNSSKPSNPIANGKLIMIRTWMLYCISSASSMLVLRWLREKRKHVTHLASRRMP